MLDNCKSIKERWGGVSKILDGWLQQRQELIVEFCTISGVHDSSSIYAKDTSEGLRHFCELMVDYISAGHFEVYDHLIQEAEEFNDGKGLDVARRLYPEVSNTTEVALAFNDSFDAFFSTDAVNPNLARELSLLGETLVSRFELEDQLIESLHYSHSELVANA
ncbi:MAG: sigma D regulator [Pseudomonadales bacterium]